MSRHAGRARWLPIPRRPTPPMRPGDAVAPGGVSRRASLILLGLSIFLFAILTGIGFGIVQDSTNGAAKDARLSQADVDEIRNYLAERRTVREAEDKKVQARLDGQTAALCAALAEVAKDARPSGYAALQRAAKKLGCDPLPKPRPTSTTSSTTRPSSSDTSGSSSGRTATTDRPAAARPSSTPSATPRPTPTPSPTIPPPAATPTRGVLCDVLGICL